MFSKINVYMITYAVLFIKKMNLLKMFVEKICFENMQASSTTNDFQ